MCIQNKSSLHMLKKIVELSYAMDMVFFIHFDSFLKNKNKKTKQKKNKKKTR